VKRLWLLAPVAVLALVLVSSIPAAKPGPGTSTGTGRVFVPNPVQSLGNESLTDQKDSDLAVPIAAYYGVTLTNLDGSGFLRGDWANIVSETGNPAYSPTNTFNYTRSQDEFEQVMAYFWITEAQKYIQSLGFGKVIFKARQLLAALLLGYSPSGTSVDNDPLLRYCERFSKTRISQAEDCR
jgi:hypothetical protein